MHHLFRISLALICCLILTIAPLSATESNPTTSETASGNSHKGPAGVRLRFLHWNIGHFNGGKGPVPTISDPEELARTVTAYKAVFNHYAADIVGICEYSKTMATYDSSATRSILFPMYRNAIEGNIGAHKYICSALFSREGLEFNGAKYIELGNGYYGLYTTIAIGNKDVIFCELHTPWQTAELNVAANQKLVDFFKDYNYVVLAGDFNTRAGTDTSFLAFINQGYAIANTQFSYMGEMPTYASQSYPCLDNILVKGGSILRTEAILEAPVRTLERKGNMTADEGAYFDYKELIIKIGRDYPAPDGYIYNLSDHLPIFCEIAF